MRCRLGVERPRPLYFLLIICRLKGLCSLKALRCKDFTSALVRVSDGSKCLLPRTQELALRPGTKYVFRQSIKVPSQSQDVRCGCSFASFCTANERQQLSEGELVCCCCCLHLHGMVLNFLCWTLHFHMRGVFLTHLLPALLSSLLRSFLLYYATQTRHAFAGPAPGALRARCHAPRDGCRYQKGLGASKSLP
jgi:hypothetical protein